MPTSDLSCLQRALDPVYPIVILVDPVLGDPLPISIRAEGQDLQREREAAWQRSVVRIPFSQRVPLKPYQHPYLVEMRGIDDPLLEATLAWAHAEAAESQRNGLDGDGGAPHRVGGWLQSSLHLKDLAAVLMPLHTVNTLATTEATYLRVADRRVLALLRYVVGPERIEANFGDLHSWHYLDMKGQLESMNSRPRNSGCLLLSREEWRLMQRGEIVNRSISMWLGELAAAKGPAAWRGPVEDLHKLTFESIKTADEASRRWPHRFKKAHDQALWVALSLLHPELRCIPTLIDEINSVMQDHGTPEAPAESLQYIREEISELLEQQPHRKSPASA